MFRKNVVQTIYRYRVSTPWGETATAVIQAESPEAGRLQLCAWLHNRKITVGRCLGEADTSSLTLAESLQLEKGVYFP